MSDIGDIDEEELSLFRESVGFVHPIRQDSAHCPKTKPAPVPAQRVADERQAVRDMAMGLHDTEILETGDGLYFKRDGVQSRLFQKLKRGQFRLESELDLHGMTIAVAKEAICAFLAKAQQRNWRCVRIIHGKGYGSAKGVPVLKSKVNNWLQQRDDVLAFCSARQVDGGTGAIYVLLKKSHQ
jgi:DNA-nicking Smr family endonuclease